MKRFSSQHGVGLIEVMVAVLLLSVAVLGFSALQLRAIKATEESLVRTQSLSVVRGLAENMRANPSQMQAYQDAIKEPKTDAKKCNTLDNKCTSAEIATKEANAAVKKLKEYDVRLNMIPCPGTSSFSEVKCIVAAWGDTVAKMDASDDLACADADGIYKSGSNCVIVETY